jgi:MFS transporter, DHA1 family, tetracycline resistance protein
MAPAPDPAAASAPAVAIPTANRIMGLIAAIVFLDMVGIGLILPVTPGLLASLGHANVQEAAVIGGALALTYSLMLFFCAPIIGGLSDRYGRRPVLLITLCAMGLDYLLMAWAPSLVWLFIGRAISGIMGATWAAANSTIADLFPPAERTAKFGLLGGVGAAGFVLGPAIGGILGEISLRLPFIIAALFAIMGAVAGWFMLIEPLSPERRRRFTWQRANPLGTLLQMRKIPAVIGILGAWFLFNLGSQATLTVWAFSLIERFQWTPLAIGLSVATYGLLLAAIQGGASGPLTQRFGTIRTAALGCAAAVPAFTILAFAPNGVTLYVGIIIGAVGGLAFPAFQGLMSARVDADAQGELQGAVASVISISALAGPLIMPPIFATFSDDRGLYLPGAPFLLGALLSVAGGLLFWRTVRRHISVTAPPSMHQQ